MLLSHPIFTSTVISAIIPYFLSILWSYRTYTLTMTPREKEILWAGLAGKKTDDDDCLPQVSTLRVWMATASFSVVAFMASWIASLLNLPQKKSYSDYVFCIIILLQSVLMVLLVVAGPSKHDVGKSDRQWIILSAKIVLVGVVLWAAALSYIWLWYICWERFSSSSMLKWVLHFLNICLVFHGVWWDAIFWWCTWCKEMIRDSQ